MDMLYRYDENELYLGEIEQIINPMFTVQDEPIDKGYYDADGNPPKPPVVGQNERAVWIGYRYSIEPEYISLTNTTTISPGDQPEGKFFDGREWK